MERPEMERSEEGIRDKAKLALNAILQNIQALEVSFASKVLKAFREAAGEEGELGFDSATKVLQSLKLNAFVQGGRDAGLPLGSGEEWRRLWRLWKSEKDTVDEQLFLFLAWRGHRFCDHSFVKDIAHPLFLALDLDNDSKVSWADLESLFRQGETGVWNSSDEAEGNIDLMQLLDYHAGNGEADGNKDPERSIGFPSFLAWICDAQDTAAIRRAAQARPMECVLRFDRFLVFMRPQDLGACVDPKEEEDFDAVLGESPQELALKAAKVALQEARDAKQLADAAQQAVSNLTRSQPGTPSAQEQSSDFGIPQAAPPTPGRSPLVQSMIEEAPLADTPMPVAVRTPPTMAAPVRSNVERKIEVKTLPAASVQRPGNLPESLIEEAPVVEEPKSQPSPRAKFDKKKSLRPAQKKIHISVTDITCRGCGNVIKSDSNYCRHCGMPIKGRRSSTSLRVEKASSPSARDHQPRPPPNPRYCALDADTESLPMAETPARNSSPEEEWEDEHNCAACGAHYLPGANFCSNCGRKREKVSVPVTEKTPRTPSMTPSSLLQTTMSTASPAQTPKSQAGSPSAKVKMTSTVRDGGEASAGYANAVAEASRSVAVAPSSAPQWKKISADGGGTPTATVGLDMTGSGKPNLYIKGEDANRDGIPDVLLSEGATILVQNGPPVSVKSDASTLQKPPAASSGGNGAVKAVAAAPAASLPALAAASAGAAAGAGAAASGLAEDEEWEWYEEDEEGEEEEGEFEDDPVVDVPSLGPPQAAKLKGASQR